MTNIVTLDGGRFYQNAREYINEITSQADYVKFLLLTLTADGSGNLHKYNMTDEQAITELETAKTYIIGKRMQGD